MIKGRALDHIGLACTDVEAAKNWYVETLGFRVIGAFDCGKEQPAYFVTGSGVTYEMYQDDDLSDAAKGKIDHISYISCDIEADYAECVAKGYTITTNGIEALPAFWENGCRYFKILSPTGEQVEFNQIL